MSVTIINLYKIWYITSACVIALAFLLILTGVLKTTGLLKSISSIILYYFYLFVTSTWAKYPDVTIFYVTIEMIYIGIFALFYLLSINFTIDRIINFFVYLTPAAIIIYITLFLINPESSRIGGYTLFLLPFLLFFWSFRLIKSFSIFNIVFMTICLLMLILSKSRAPLMISGLGLLIILAWVTNRSRIRRKFLARIVFIGLLVLVPIIAIPRLRYESAQMIVRIAYEDMVVGDQIIQAEKPDQARWQMYGDVWSLFKANWLLGMGYMNFKPWAGDIYNYRQENARGEVVYGLSLHNVFHTWALEGGLTCLLIITFVISKYFIILRRRIKHSENYLDKSYYKLLCISMICLLVLGLFHQIHQTPLLFVFLGIVYALDDKKRKKGSRLATPPVFLPPVIP